MESVTHPDPGVWSLPVDFHPVWAMPAHDAAGNMTTVPQPDAPASEYTLTWDAWNRLVKVSDGTTTVAEYAWDGSNRRIVKKIYAGGVLDETRHIYLSRSNQVLEERVDSSTSADRQFTWSIRYIDDLVLRTRDTDASGTLDESLYALQDANWNITALTDTSGTVVERFRYTPYGRSTVLDANFTADADGMSDYDWEYRFTSREYDGETALHYFRARFYHDGIGRFMGRDPLGYRGSRWNLQTAFSVPNFLDPSGSIPIFCSCRRFRWTGVSNKRVRTNCKGLASRCCAAACPEPYSFTGEWDIIGAAPSTPAVHPAEAAVRGAIDGAQAWCDGVIPYYDPFSKYGFYDPHDRSLRISRCCGTASRDLLLLAWGSSGGISGWGAWCRNPRLYERGCITLPTHVYQKISHLRPIEKGRWLKTHGYGYLAPKGFLSFPKTIWTGLTPGASLGLVGGCRVADHFGSVTQ